MTRCYVSLGVNVHTYAVIARSVCVLDVRRKNADFSPPFPMSLTHFVPPWWPLRATTLKYVKEGGPHTLRMFVYIIFLR